MIVLLLMLVVPIGASAAKYWFGDRSVNWQVADRSSAGLLPPPSGHPDALVRVFAARTVRWKGIFAVHSWIVFKERNAQAYTRYDYTAWGEPIWVNGFAADGRWFGDVPDVVAAADGDAAAQMIPKSAPRSQTTSSAPKAITAPGRTEFQHLRHRGARRSPELRSTLPPTAIGKDYPYDDRWIGLTPSRTGIRLSLDGYLGVTAGWVEGLEINFFGAVFGIDLRRPAIKLPGLGRIGLAQTSVA